MARYTGEVFAHEPYAAWAVGLREETRTAYLRALRALAQAHRAAGDHDRALAHLARLLDHDPYDEPTHEWLVRTLVAAGRHGEARRAFNRYADAMREIDVPTPDAVLLKPVPLKPVPLKPVPLKPVPLKPVPLKPVSQPSLTAQPASRRPSLPAPPNGRTAAVAGAPPA